MSKFTTKQAAPEQSKSGKWCAAFETWVTRNGETYLMMTGSSAPVFDTAADAEEGGKRAIKVLEETGVYPNMCEKF
jgi:hypothetical protein